MLRTVASRDPSQVQVLDIDKVVSPGNRYQRELRGKLCRFDGIHFAVYCSQVLAPDVLTAVRRLIDTTAPTTTPGPTTTALTTPTPSNRG